ncbi:MAG TPA: amidohydrolase family protein [Mycobacterium sp.]|nr:amidohydrolase family protein [Mycobacterium sp.]HUH70186.1 amidohydrolase family protein [Mycobacterium sp.]
MQFSSTAPAVPGEILTTARIALAHQRGLDHDHSRQVTGILSTMTSITSKQALSWATVEGARALGLVEHVGQIQPSMQTDLIVVDATALNLWPSHDPIAAALHASLANIEAVMLAGQWRKRDHRLADVDLDDLKDRLLESRRRLVPHRDR